MHVCTYILLYFIGKWLKIDFTLYHIIIVNIYGKDMGIDTKQTIGFDNAI